MLRYWNNLVKMEDSRLPMIMYNQMKHENNLWFKDIKCLHVFQSVNALAVLERHVPTINAKQFYIYHAEGKLLSDWASVVENKLKLHYYKAIKMTT